MQFKAVLSVLSFALAASAVPTGSTTPACTTGGQKLSCCQTLTSTGLLGILQGLNCVNVLNIGDCNANQQAACCSNVSQNALIGVQCSPVNIQV